MLLRYVCVIDTCVGYSGMCVLLRHVGVIEACACVIEACVCVIEACMFY